MSYPGGWTKVSKTVDIGSVAANSKGTQTVTVKGVTTAMRVVAIPPATLEDDILAQFAYVSAANTITVVVYNPTGSPIDPASATWTFIIFVGDGNVSLTLG